MFQCYLLTRNNITFIFIFLLHLQGMDVITTQTEKTISYLIYQRMKTKYKSTTAEDGDNYLCTLWFSPKIRCFVF